MADFANFSNDDSTMLSPDEYYLERRKIAESDERTILEAIYKYLLFTNAGGVAVLLAFTADNNQLLSQPMWISAISAFLAGILFTGLYAYAGLRYVQAWIASLDHYRRTGEMSERGTMAKRLRAVLGWIAFLLFMIGSALAIVVAVVIQQAS